MSGTERPKIIGYALKAGANLPRDWEGPTAYTVEEFNDLIRKHPGVAGTVRDNYTTPLYARMGWLSITINAKPWETTLPSK